MYLQFSHFSKNKENYHDKFTDTFIYNLQPKYQSIHGCSDRKVQ